MRTRSGATRERDLTPTQRVAMDEALSCLVVCGAEEAAAALGPKHDVRAGPGGLENDPKEWTAGDAPALKRAVAALRYALAQAAGGASPLHVYCSLGLARSPAVVLSWVLELKLAEPDQLDAVVARLPGASGARLPSDVRQLLTALERTRPAVVASAEERMVAWKTLGLGAPRV